jgi:copper(I)-binding protein
MVRLLSHKKYFGVVTLGLIALGLSSCQTTAGEEVVVSEAWVKAGDGSMTGMFAELSNPSSSDIALIGGSSPSAGFVEIHEVADGVMREKEGGVVIPAGGAATLEPGGDHVMLMGLTEPLLAGQTVSITLSFDDGSDVSVEVMVKEFAGANEDYDPSHDDNDMDMGNDRGGDKEMNNE